MSSETRQLSLAALLGAVYIATNWMPFSSYIGGAGFITASVIMVPVVAALLRPRYAVITGLIGGIGINIFVQGYAMVMPWYSILIPMVAMVLGSIAFHSKTYSWAPGAFLALEGALYLVAYEYKATPLFLTHYIIGILASLYYFLTGKFKAGLIFSTAMCDNAMLNIGSIMILGLPAELWIVIFPVSFAERIVATVGGYLLLKAIQRFIPTTYFEGLEGF